MESPRESIREGQFSKAGKDAGLASLLPSHRLAQNRIILRIVEDCVKKLKLSMVMPNIFENPITFCELVKGTKFEECGNALLKYLRERDKSFEFKVDGKPCYDFKLMKLINLFHMNHEMLNLLPIWPTPSAVRDHSIVEAFDILTHIVDQRIHRAAASEIKKEKELHQMHQKSMQLRKEIDALSRKLRIYKQKRRWKRAMRDADIAQPFDELLADKWHHYFVCAEVIVSNSKRVTAMNHAHTIRVHQLVEECAAAEAEFQKLKASNERQLSNAREEKNKVLIQFQTMIEKHDRILGDKIKENVYLQDEFERKQAEMDRFLIGYTAVEEEYNMIIAEEEREWQARADFFFQTRAARIIQRYLRLYLAEQRAIAAKAAVKKKK